MRKLLLGLTAFLFFTGSLLAQKTVTGTVTDNNGNPLPGVSVVVVGTSTGTVTKTDGTYSIEIPQNATQLQFTYLGFTTQTVTIGSRNAYSITLVPSTDAGELEGVIVTGIARVKKSQFTGAANKIDAKELENRPVGSLDQLFQGRAPGLLALTGSGQPGNPTTIIIRGTSSVEGGSTPLYVIDGIPVEAGVFQGLNPNDIASIDVLRDAATLALYGSRGSAGVIVVTTKRGSGGKMKLTYTGQYGIKSKPDFAFRPMNTTELLQSQHDYGNIVRGSSNSNANLIGWFYSPDNPRYATLSPAQQAQADRALDSISQIEVNWADYYFRQGNFSNHQVTLSGGSGKTRLYSSLALYNEQGTTPRTDMKRVTLTNNADYADDRFSLSVSSIIGYVKRNFQQSTTTNSVGNPFLAANIALPYKMPYLPDGSIDNGDGSFLYLGANQIDLTKYDKNYNNQLKLTLGVTANYKITRDLTAAVTTGVDFRETQNTNYGSKLAFTRVISTSVTGHAGFQTEGLTRLITSSVRPSLTYRKTFSDVHDIEISAVGEYVDEQYKNIGLTGYGIDPRTPNTPAAITQGNSGNQLYAVVGGGKFQDVVASGLATLRYTYNDKYTITGSFRDDGSSKLPEQNRWQQFFAVGLIWDAAKEDFIRNIRAINVLRLRVSYGNSGNHNNFPRTYLYQATYGNGGYGGLTTQVATYPGYPDARWETTYVTNIGLDFELFNRRVYGDINLYDKLTKDLFLSKTLTAEGGFWSIDVNSGKLSNKGFEWNINADIIRNKTFVWTVFATGGYNKNELTDLGGQTPYESGTSYLKEGLPLGSHYEVKWGGVDAATGQPLYYDSTGKLTNIYSADNKVSEFGTWEAPWKGGFGTNLRYKGLELSVLFSWQAGADKYDNLEYFTENPVGFLGTGQFNQSADLKFWQQPGDIVNTPSPLYGVSFSSKLIHNSDFVRLRDIVLAYSFPASITEKLKFISSARIYVQGTNLFMWTKWRGMDPEAGPVNINLSEFPNPRAFTGGITVTF